MAVQGEICQSNPGKPWHTCYQIINNFILCIRTQPERGTEYLTKGRRKKDTVLAAAVANREHADRRALARDIKSHVKHCQNLHESLPKVWGQYCPPPPRPDKNSIIFFLNWYENLCLYKSCHRLTCEYLLRISVNTSCSLSSEIK